MLVFGVEVGKDQAETVCCWADMSLKVNKQERRDVIGHRAPLRYVKMGREAPRMGKEASP